jgi:hypothetical protein
MSRPKELEDQLASLKVPFQHTISQMLSSCMTFTLIVSPYNCLFHSLYRLNWICLERRSLDLI